MLDEARASRPTALARADPVDRPGGEKRVKTQGSANSQRDQTIMKAKLFFSTAMLALLLSPLASEAQTLSDSIQNGAAEGSRSGGPVGAVLGSVGGGVVGITGGLFGRMGSTAYGPTAQSYARAAGIPSQNFPYRLTVGTQVPRGYALYAVPPQAGVDSRYLVAVFNNQAVLVDRHTRRIVQISPA